VFLTSSSGFVLRKVIYTVPSRLTGFRLRVRLYDDRLECFLGENSPLLTLPRGRSHGAGRHGHVVDYRHVIRSLRCKPMTLLNLVYATRCSPVQPYRQVWEKLQQRVMHAPPARRWSPSWHSPMNAAAKPNSPPFWLNKSATRSAPARRRPSRAI